MAKTVKVKHKQWIDTAAAWAAGNPVLLAGQLGIVSDSSPKRIKVGDGVTAWNSLPYSAEIPGIVSIEANKILGSNAAGNGYEFKESVALAQVIMLLYNEETDSNEVISSTNESAALKSFETNTALTYSKLFFEIIVQSRVEQSANTKCDFTYRLKKDGATLQTWVDRIIASSTTGIVSGGRNTTSFSYILDGPFPTGNLFTVTAQNSLNNANTGSKIRAFRVYAVTDASLMRGANGLTPYIQDNYWWVGSVNTGVLALGGINAGSTVTFNEALAKDTLISGETIGVIFGKIKKWFSSFGALAWKTKASFADDIDNKPTTVAGYGITNAYTKDDVYTKTEVDNKIPPLSMYHMGVVSGSTDTLYGLSDAGLFHTRSYQNNISLDTYNLITGTLIYRTWKNVSSSSITISLNTNHIYGLGSSIVIPANTQICLAIICTSAVECYCSVFGMSTILDQ
jgi:hypothetical protein